MTVLAADRGQGKRGRGLLVHEGSQARLALDDAIGDVHLAAHRRQPHDELNRVDIVGDAHELSLLLLAQLGDVVDAKLDADRLLLVLLRAGLLLLRLTLHTLLLGLLVLRPVLVQQLEQVDGQVLVQRVLELVDRRRHLQPLVQHLALALDAHVLRPLDVAAEVTLRLNVLANSEVLRLLLPDRARRRGRRGRRLLRVHVGSRSRGLLSLGSLGHGGRS
mmetsp:Transcript_27498/g.65558  ORF Transcript_27498/g.65558 Transcript_27498/m.65558 type:complete len:219 (+) Transcript_27498:232-888(+)